jgi:2'-hydroxyisoflavone reductase
MKLLVLGGTRFVGRALVEAALADGIDVTTLNRGNRVVPGPAGQVPTLIADRTDPAGLRLALGDTSWDAVIDTWSGAPKIVADACELLRDSTGYFGYVSTVSVYVHPLSLTAVPLPSAPVPSAPVPSAAGPVPSVVAEDAPTVEADPDDDQVGDSDAGYQRAKRGAELAVLRAFGAEALLARPGLILGPYENLGRLPFWLRRIERGGRVLAPGGPGCPVQYVDVRDLARWMIDMAKRRVGGTYNVVNHPGESTLGQFLTAAITVTRTDAGSGGASAGREPAELVWVPEELILAAGVEPWTELPLWMPRDWEQPADPSAAYAAGFTARTVEQTVADTWAWLQAEGDPPLRPDRLSPEKEQAVLSQLR